MAIVLPDNVRATFTVGADLTVGVVAEVTEVTGVLASVVEVVLVVVAALREVNE